MAERIIDVEIDGIQAETEKAYRVTVGRTTEWVPKSQVEYNPDDGIMTMPEWLAMEKGFI